MIGRRRRPPEQAQPAPRGFDDFELRLGDIMRGERATIGKSLLDVQRELKIKATYIAAIENADVTAFETPGFIAGYVRSYARYLGLDPDWAYAAFCEEADFVSATALESGSAAAGRSFRKPAGTIFDTSPRDPIAQPRVSFAPKAESAFSMVEPRAVASTLVLLGLIGAIGYGGWAILREVQRVQITPVDRAPAAVAEVDPLDGAVFAEAEAAPEGPGIGPTTPDALYRLYRPEALDVPVMVPRDGPIAALDPAQTGALAATNQAGPGPDVVSRGRPGPADAGLPRAPAAEVSPRQAAIAALQAGGFGQEPRTPRVTAEALPEVMLVAVEEVWLRVRAADGTILNERMMQAGDTYVVPQTETPPSLRVGNAGGVYFAVNGVTYGPAGARGAVEDQIALGAQPLTEVFAQADPAASDSDRRAIEVAEAALGLEPTPLAPQGAAPSEP